MEIRDPIHGNIRLDQTEEKIVDTPEMQRLRYIRQLDTTYLIFPGANHSRFEHSLGTMQVTKELAKNIYDKEPKELAYVGLLHDIGHGPFSHLSESVIKKYLKKNHEQIGEEVIRQSGIKEIISDSGLSFDKIMSYFKESDKIDIVGGALGSDRIDYLMRDSHYTGVAYGIIDYDRIKSRLVLYRDKVAILESGISGAESMLIARYFMHKNVYWHHAKTISNKMLVRAIELAVENGIFDAERLSRMCDDELFQELANSKVEAVSELANRVKSRELFKRAYDQKISREVNTQKLEEEIVNSGLDISEFVVQIVSLGGGQDNLDVIGSNNEYLGKLTEFSPFVKTLTEVLTNSKRLLVACDKKNVEKLRAIVTKFVG